MSEQLPWTSDERPGREQFFQAVFEQSAIGVAIVELDGRPVLANAALERFLGYSAAELNGRTYHSITLPDDLAVDAELATKLSTGELDHYVVEKRYVRKDGRVVWGRLTVSVLRTASGDPQFVLAMVEDIDDRKRAEASVGRLEEQFRHSQKMDAVGQLAGGIAHDFNNFLTVIHGCTEILLDELDPTNELRSDVMAIQQATECAAVLTRQLLAFSRKQALRPTTLDLSSITAGLQPMVQRLIGDHIQVVTHHAADLWPISADPGQLEQVLMNLAVNARDAMPEGGTLVIQTANLHLDATSAERDPAVLPGDYVMLMVSDTGIGMDEATRSRVFEPFFTTKEVGQGTGLGLSTVYGIVAQSNGCIWCESAPGRGTTFKVYLPRAREVASNTR